MALDSRGAETSLLANDVPGRGYCGSSVHTGWTSQRWRWERLSVWAPFAGRAPEGRVVYSLFVANTWINFCSAAAPPELGFEPPGLVDVHSAQLVPERRQNNGQEQLP